MKRLLIVSLVFINLFSLDRIEFDDEPTKEITVSFSLIESKVGCNCLNLLNLSSYKIVKSKLQCKFPLLIYSAEFNEMIEDLLLDETNYDKKNGYIEIYFDDCSGSPLVKYESYNFGAEGLIELSEVRDIKVIQKN